MQKLDILKEIVKNNFDIFDIKFIILNYVSIITVILPIFTPIIAKLTYALMLKNVFSILLTIVIQKNKIIIKLNYNNMFSNI